MKGLKVQENKLKFETKKLATGLDTARFQDPKKK